MASDGIVGRFAQCETWVKPAFSALSFGAEFSYARDAFDEHLELVRLRRATVQVLIEHSGMKNIGSTLGGSVRLWRDGLDLMFSVRPIDEWGIKTIQAIRGQHRRKLSFGADNILTQSLAPVGGTPRIIVTKAKLTEISLVDNGSFDTWLRFPR